MRLSILPGTHYALFSLQSGAELTLELVPCTRFLEVLAAYARATRFEPAPPCPSDPAELLPWAGNV